MPGDALSATHFFSTCCPKEKNEGRNGLISGFEDNSGQWEEAFLLSSEEISVSFTSDYVGVSPRCLEQE